MKYLQQFDTKGRIRIGTHTKKFFKDENAFIFFSKDHLTIFEKENYDKYISIMSGYYKLDKYNFAVLINGETAECNPDNQGRVLIPMRYRSKIFKNEKEIYVVPLEYEGIKLIEVYPKSVYEKEIENLVRSDETIKGKENEEGRRKD